MWEKEQEEKRNAPRIKKPLVIQYSVKRGIDKAEIWDQSVINDISQTGASFNSSKQLASGETFVILLYSPANASDKIKINARVVESGASSVGVHRTRVEFINVAEEERLLLESCIAQFLDKTRGGEK